MSNRHDETFKADFFAAGNFYLFDDFFIKPFRLLDESKIFCLSDGLFSVTAVSYELAKIFPDEKCRAVTAKAADVHNVGSLRD